MSPPGPPPGLLPGAARTGPLTERTPPRRSCAVIPLIDGDATQRALEAALLDAAETVELAYWQLDPGLLSRTAFALHESLHAVVSGADQAATWPVGTLVIDALARGATVRVLISDFEPLLEPDLHVKAWSSYFRLHDLVTRAARLVSTVDAARFELACALHPATIHPGALTPLTGDPASAEQLERTIGEQQLDAVVDWLNDLVAADRAWALDTFDLAPRLWDKFAFDQAAGAFTATAAPPLSYAVASHHVKLCVVDGERALLGGFNLNQHLKDSDPAHTLPTTDANVTHDVHVEVRGAVATDLRRFFTGLWNASVDEAEAFLDAANELAPRDKLPRLRLTSMTVPGTHRGAPGGTHTAQLVRTVTGYVPPPVPVSRHPPLPEVLAGDTEEAYSAAIDSAETYVYLENQYLRWAPLAERLTHALRARQTLQAIIVVPFRPEEGGDPVTWHGNAMQFDALSKLVTTFSPRVGLFTLVSPTTPADVEYRNARTVYVHSKVLIVDDRLALVGSANLNGRSFRVDTEVGLAWTGGGSVARFRRELWAHLLGAATDQGRPEQFLARWHGRAFRNRHTTPAQRVGFVVHLDVAALARGMRIDSPLQPVPALRPLAPALNVYASGLRVDRTAPRSALPQRPRVS